MDFLGIAVHQQDGSVDVNVDGTLDLRTADRFEGATRHAIDRAEKRVNLFLENVSFIDSTGIKVLVESRNLAIKKGVDVRIVQASRTVQRVLELMDLDGYFFDGAPEP